MSPTGPHLLRSFIRLGVVAAAAIVLAIAMSRGGPKPAFDPEALETSAPRRAAFAGPYSARIVRIVDGDTFEARLTVWFG